MILRLIVGLVVIMGILAWGPLDPEPPSVDMAARNAWHDETRAKIAELEDAVGELAGLVDAAESRSMATAQMVAALADSMTTIVPRVNQPDRRDGIIVPCAGNNRNPPLGLRVQSPDQWRLFYQRHYARLVELGLDRLIWHMPAGFGDADGMAGSAAVLGAMAPEHRAVFLEDLANFKAGAGADKSVGVYISARLISDTQIIGAPAEPYDHENPRHVEIMYRILRPLAEAGISEVWFDAASTDEVRGDILRLADDLVRDLGLHVVIEAMPRYGDGHETETYRRVGACALHRFMVDKQLELADAPPGAEAIVMLSNHAIASAPDRSTPTAADVQNYRARGYTIFSMSEGLDPLLSAGE